MVVVCRGKILEVRADSGFYRVLLKLLVVLVVRGTLVHLMRPEFNGRRKIWPQRKNALCILGSGILNELVFHRTYWKMIQSYFYLHCTKATDTANV